MKTISKFFGLVLAVAITFSSCSSDDNGPAPTPVEKDTTYVYTAAIKGFAPSNENDKVEYTLTEIALAQIIGETNAKNFISGEFQNTGTYMEVSGLKNVAGAPSLKNFTLQVNATTPINFGTCKANASETNEFSSDTQQSGNKYVTFGSSIFSNVISKARKVSLKVSFTPTKDILATDNVVLKIAIRGKYRYNTYPTK